MTSTEIDASPSLCCVTSHSYGFRQSGASLNVHLEAYIKFTKLRISPSIWRFWWQESEGNFDDCFMSRCRQWEFLWWPEEFGDAAFTTTEQCKAPGILVKNENYKLAFRRGSKLAAWCMMNAWKQGQKKRLPVLCLSHFLRLVFSRSFHTLSYSLYSNVLRLWQCKEKR